MATTTDELTGRATSLSSQQPTGRQSDNPEEIEAQIEQTRAQMGETIDEIQTRLSPQYLKQQTQEAIREATVEKVEKMANQAEMKVRRLRRGAIETVKDNPIPMALIGIGIGWMLLNDNDGRDYDYGYYRQRPVTDGDRYRYYDRQEGRYYETEAGGDITDRIGEEAEDVKEWASEQVDAAKDKVSRASDTARQKGDEAVDNIREQAEHTAERTQEAAYRVRTQARHQKYRAQRTFTNTLNENPLALGIAALAAGALVGLALPSTDVEDRLVGETRDRLVEEAKEETKQVARKAQAVAEKAQHAAVEEAKREAEKQDLTQEDGIATTTDKKKQQQTTSTSVTH